MDEDKPTDSLHSLFKKYHVNTVFAGHYHSYFQARYDGINYVIAGRAGGGATTNNPTYMPKDSRYSAPDFEPHMYLIVDSRRLGNY